MSAEPTGRGSSRQLTDDELQDLVAATDTGARQPTNAYVLRLVLAVAFLWSAFQLWYASGLAFQTGFISVSEGPARAIHLGFGIFLAFLAYPMLKRSRRDRVPWHDWALAIVGAFCASYRLWFYADLASRPGRPIDLDIWVSALGLLLLLEAARRSLGPALVVVAGVFILYTFFGYVDFIPEVIRYQGASFNRAMDQYWLSDQGVFGIAVGVSARYVFLFVLFGALLDKAGAGNYFIKVAFSLLGHLRGGPAKAAVVASGMTGLISGSSIANVVTTGTFTVPLMKRVGFTPEKAGAVEVASSVNGQIMPPVMGAAAFLMVEYVGIPYTEVIRHAFLPAIISYVALVYIVHVEAMKRGMQGLPKPGERLPAKWALFGFLFSVLSILILASAVFWLFSLAAWLDQAGLGLLAVIVVAGLELVYFGVLRRRLPRHWLRRVISIGAIVLANAVIGAYGIFFLMEALNAWLGPSGATWAAIALLLVAYVALVWYGAQYPELELDDPNARIIRLPEVGPTVKTGLHFLLPILVLVWLLMVERQSPQKSAFWATIFLVAIALTQRPVFHLFRRKEDFGRFLGFVAEALRNLAALLANYAIAVLLLVAVTAGGNWVINAAGGRAWPSGEKVPFEIACFVVGLLTLVFLPRLRLSLMSYGNRYADFHQQGLQGFTDVFDGMVAGARNMIGIALATATAGIIVGTVALTGIGIVMTDFVEFLSGGSILLMLFLVAILSLILGMGLPTTANYIVVSTLMAPVIVDVGAANGLIVPLIAVHLFVFYFGIMADVTPPVGLASFAAAAVSGGDPMRTGFTAFWYSLRTAALPFMFIYNTDLILYNPGGPVELVLTVVTATLAMLIFAAATQGWFIVRCRAWEIAALLLVAFTLFRPAFWVDMVAPPELVERSGTALYETIEETPPGSTVRVRASGEDFITGEPKEVDEVIQLGPGATPADRLQQYGLTLIEGPDGAPVVQAVAFGSRAEAAGFDLDFTVDAVLVEQAAPKQLAWIPALLLLALIVRLQLGRSGRRRQPAPA